MRFSINPADREPLYQQLVDQVRLAVARGTLKTGDQLPSVRALSRDLVINPNTVARAYALLEQEGFLVTRQGKGVYIGEPRMELTQAARERRLTESVDRLLIEAVHLAFTAAEVVAAVRDRAEKFEWPSHQKS